jgi:hypothetical protein
MTRTECVSLVEDFYYNKGQERFSRQMIHSMIHSGKSGFCADEAGVSAANEQKRPMVKRFYA